MVGKRWYNTPMKTRWAFLFIFLVIIGLVLVPCFALSEETGGNKEEIEVLNKEIESRKSKIKELEEAISKYQKSIEQKQLEANSLKNQMALLDNHTARLETEIDLTREKIKEAELQIEALNLIIKDKEDSIAKQKKIITTLVQHLNAEGERQYIEILLTNNSFVDFFSQVKYLEKVYIDLGSSVRLLRLAKADLDAKKKQAEEKQSTYLALKAELDNKRQDLQEQSNTKSVLLARTKSSELRYRTLLESQRQQYQAIEGELRSYEEQVRKKLEAQDKISGSSDVLFSWPAVSHYITASFHDPDYPYRNVFEHSGIDIRASQGTPIKAAAAGYIARAKRCTTASCYSYILIVHTGNLSTIYGHLSGIAATEDQFVNRGDIIGYEGTTGFSTGPHLHFEVRENGIPVDPQLYLGN